jgi:DNA-binding NarL/FixJ family response regulator
VRAVHRARGKLRKRDPERALATWRGLVAGRWSLVDRFEADGRRFIIAHPNAPDAPDPRALTPRERQVAGYVALGQSNKLIAYELGISPSTVGVLVGRAAKKLGAKSRAALASTFVPREDVSSK